jgi:hypothetical protein
VAWQQLLSPRNNRHYEQGPNGEYYQTADGRRWGTDLIVAVTARPLRARGRITVTEPAPKDAYSLREGEIEKRYDQYVLKLKQAIKILKSRGPGGSGEAMRPMDSDNPLDSPDRWDI